MSAADYICTCGERRSRHTFTKTKVFCPGSETRTFDPDPAYIVGTDEYRARIEREGQMTIGEK